MSRLKSLLMKSSGDVSLGLRLLPDILAANPRNPFVATDAKNAQFSLMSRYRSASFRLLRALTILGISLRYNLSISSGVQPYSEASRSTVSASYHPAAKSGSLEERSSSAELLPLAPDSSADRSAS